MEYKHKRKPYKCLNDVCYSLANLALITAAIIGFIFLVLFFNDDLLNEYIELLFSVAFYRQLIYIAIIIPLALLIPLFNALTAIFRTNRTTLDTSFSLLLIRVAYIALIAVLVLVGLIFVVPYIQCGTVANQLEWVFAHHMGNKYVNDFSYQFLDLIQEHYRCCDTLYYRVNYDSSLPLTCFDRNGTFNLTHRETCPRVIGELVCTRCIIISICLFIILISLVALGVIGILELVGQEYDVEAREANAYRISSSASLASNRPSRQLHDSKSSKLLTNKLASSWPEYNINSNNNNNKDHDDDDEKVDLRFYNDQEESSKDNNKDDVNLVDNISERLRLDERDRDTPSTNVVGNYPKRKDHLSQIQPSDRDRNINSLLLLKGNSNSKFRRERPSPISVNDEHLFLVDNNNQNESEDVRPILTRANYTSFSNRPKSPILLSSNSGHREDSSSLKSGHSSPTKSAMKKSASLAKFDSDEEETSPEEETIEEETVHEYQRHTQSRRSLLNVRFADV